MKHHAPSTQSLAGPAGKLRVTTEGNGGMPVVFLHDNAADHTHWAEVQAGLQTKTIAFDFRGLGESEGRTGPFGVEACVEDLTAVVDALVPEKFVVVGHGFGAAVAGAFASYYPERLAGLLYVEPQGDLRQTPASEQAALLEKFTPAKWGAFHEDWLGPLLQQARPSTRALVAKTLRTSRPDAIAGNAASLFQFDPTAAFDSFKGPVHALVATTGPGTLVAQRPTLTSSVAPHASHWLMLDSPQWFHTELLRFLGQCRAGH